VSGPRFRHDDGDVVVDLTEGERAMLGQVLPQLRDLIMSEDDPALRRLNPTARPDDAEAEADYRALVGDDLLRGRLEAIETVESGLDGAVLDEEGVAAWMHSLNNLRLVLGERLEDHDLDLTTGDDGGSPLEELYEWLGWLLEQLVTAATPTLADATDLDG